MQAPRRITDKKRWLRRHTSDGYALLLYENMKRRAGKKKSYENVELCFSKEQFIDFLHATDYQEIYDTWKLSKFERKYAPSVDRIDRLGHYTLDNIQILPMGENSKKGNEERRICSACGHVNY